MEGDCQCHKCTSGFKDRQALIEALVAVGFDRSQIEIHEQAVPLYGYQGSRSGLPLFDYQTAKTAAREWQCVAAAGSDQRSRDGVPRRAQMPPRFRGHMGSQHHRA